MDTMQEVKLSWPLSSLQNICWYLKNNLETILLLEKKWEDTQKLKVLCETRWASRADWLAVFINAFKVLIDINNLNHSPSFMS